VRRRYDLSENLAERQMMMHRWANYLDDLRAGKAVSFDLLTPDELTKEMESRNEQTTDIALHDRDIIIKSLQAQGVPEDVIQGLLKHL
jgi:hypothetical protein